MASHALSVPFPFFASPVQSSPVTTYLARSPRRRRSSSRASIHPFNSIPSINQFHQWQAGSKQASSGISSTIHQPSTTAASCFLYSKQSGVRIWRPSPCTNAPPSIPRFPTHHVDHVAVAVAIYPSHPIRTQTDQFLFPNPFDDDVLLFGARGKKRQRTRKREGETDNARKCCWLLLLCRKWYSAAKSTKNFLTKPRPFSPSGQDLAER